MIKFSNKTFYNRHSNEMSKYIYKKNSLHIVNKLSSNKVELKGCKTILLDLTEPGVKLNLDINKKFERILLTDVIENHPDVFSLLDAVKKMLTVDGKLVISSVNTKYLFINRLFELLNLKDKNPNTSYIHLKKINRVTNGVGLEYQKYYTKQFFPFKLLNLGNLINKILEVVFFRFNLGIKTYMIFRPAEISGVNLSKSIIIPAKNEEGNLKELVARIPKFNNAEIIFAYGESKDNTLEIMKEIIDNNTDFDFKLIKQTKTGKANAVWEALEIVENEVIGILDADISVDPETLVDFFKIIENNNADFVNGTRLVYEMEKNSMRFLNKLGNRFFQYFISRIIKEHLSDSLCGTKVFKKSYLNDLFLWQNDFKKNDPFGDFDLIFAASYSGQKIAEMPIIYRERKYGTTQISRFKDGFKLLFYLLSSFLAFNTSIDRQIKNY